MGTFEDMKQNVDRPDSTAPSVFLMIAIAFVAAIVVLILWHPWSSRHVGNVPTVTVTASP